MAVDLGFDVGRRQVPAHCHGIIEQSGYKPRRLSREEVLQPTQAREAVGINGQRHVGREEAAERESSALEAEHARDREWGRCTGGGWLKRRKAATAGRGFLAGQYVEYDAVMAAAAAVRRNPV